MSFWQDRKLKKNCTEAELSKNWNCSMRPRFKVFQTQLPLKAKLPLNPSFFFVLLKDSFLSPHFLRVKGDILCTLIKKISFSGSSFPLSFSIAAYKESARVMQFSEMMREGDTPWLSQSFSWFFKDPANNALEDCHSICVLPNCVKLYKNCRGNLYFLFFFASSCFVCTVPL